MSDEASALGPVHADSRSRETIDAHALLRNATRIWHDRVEAGFERYDLQTVAGLTAFLRRQALAQLPVEAELDARGLSRVLPDWPERRRGEALSTDLAQLGAPLPDTAAMRIALPTPERMMGALYVLEGSRLGGKILQRRVAASPEERVRSADAYLSHAGPRGGWRIFLARLNQLGSTDEKRRDALAGAEQTFALFHAAASLQDG